jgi:hypothetical protein
VLGEDIIDAASNGVESNGGVGPEEPVWEPTVLEESSCNVHVELKAVITAVNEEHQGEYGLGVCGEVSGRDEAELGIGGDRVLDSLEAEFGGHREVVETGAKLVAKCGELRGEIVSEYLT